MIILSAPKQTYRDWIISTVVDLVRKEEGHVTRIEIDMKSTYAALAKFIHSLILYSSTYL